MDVQTVEVTCPKLRGSGAELGTEPTSHIRGTSD